MQNVTHTTARENTIYGDQIWKNYVFLSNNNKLMRSVLVVIPKNVSFFYG